MLICPIPFCPICLALYSLIGIVVVYVTYKIRGYDVSFMGLCKEAWMKYKKMWHRVWVHGFRSCNC